ncbi:DNA mismatch repair protein MutS [bacterium]|nr:DNA mismatch repair protein MutS [bacterium]
MIRQFLKIKEKYPDTILLYRVGDFYETFFEDARTASRVLNIALTSRGKSSNGESIPLAGIPYHALDSYLYKLVKAGHNAAVCEQVEDPKLAEGVVKRDVVRIVTPGTIIDDKVVDIKSNNNILSIVETDDSAYTAFCDISTGEFHFCTMKKDEFMRGVISHIIKISPSEVIVESSTYGSYLEGGAELLSSVKRLLPELAFNHIDDWKGDSRYCEDQLLSHLGINTLKASGFENEGEIRAAGILLSYLKETQKSNLLHIRRMTPQRELEHMFLDLYTQLNLDILPARGGPNLFDILDLNQTPMGSRLLKKRLMRPLLDVEAIQARLDIIEELTNIDTLELEETLKGIKDIERILSKISLGVVKPPELLVLRAGLEVFPQVSSFVGVLDSAQGKAMAADMEVSKSHIEKTSEFLLSAISDSPPVVSNDTGIFREGYDAELDHLRDISKNGKSIIKGILEELKAKLNVPGIKLGYNRIHGYYFELSKLKLNEIELPPEIIRKQTLVNSERFITPELKEREEEILTVDEKIKSRERTLWAEALSFFEPYYDELSKYCSVVGRIDIYTALKNCAQKYYFSRPGINDGDSIKIKGGRHPVIEQQDLGEPFIPNDLEMNNSDSQIHIITGPNMAGKSTFLRQIAVIVLMAQVGMFIPADEAHIGVVDRIFTRIGASDNLALGQSTFMVEMNEVANILSSATDRSLIILDEVGRGTSTYDGLSIAWAVIEFLHRKEGQQAKTLFATHYHEITRIGDYLDRVEIYKVDVKEYGEKIIFLRKLIKGSADKSYGIYVAKLAGIPEDVIERAGQILAQLEEGGSAKSISQAQRRFLQPSLFSTEMPDENETEVLRDLRELDQDAIAPIDALKLLSALKKKLNEK